MRVERGEKLNDPQYFVKGLRGDMGKSPLMNLIIQSDGDAIIALRDPETNEQLSIEFCTMKGGGRNPFIARKLREIAELIWLHENDFEEFQKKLGY